MRENGNRILPQAATWAGLAGGYAAAQGASAALAGRLRGRGTRPQYDEEFGRPSFAPPGPVFPVVWSALNLTTATSAWLTWRARVRSADSGAADSTAADSTAAAALAWWAAAIVPRTGYVPLAFGRRWLWLATADSAALCAVMTLYAIRAGRADRRAALLALPEIGWTAFATVLSAAVARRTR